MLCSRPAHAEYSARLQDDNQPVVVAVGPAGTGKTFTACIEGANQLKTGASQRIVLLRPSTGVDEDIGFLPGGISDKMAPWAQPMLDAFAVVRVASPPCHKQWEAFSIFPLFVFSQSRRPRLPL